VVEKLLNHWSFYGVFMGRRLIGKKVDASEISTSIRIQRPPQFNFCCMFRINFA
jgi:hypothetical protein